MSTDHVVRADRRPSKGETVIGHDFNLFFGGKGANQAIAAARLGVPINMIGKVGDDQFGSNIIANLSKNGVMCRTVERVTGVSSGSAHITLAQEDNSIIAVLGANSLVDVAQIDASADVIAASSVVLTQGETPVAVIKHLVDLCAKLRVALIFNPAPICGIEKDVIDSVAYLTPNETEFAQIFKGISISQALKQYPRKLIVTLGRKGAIFHDGVQERLVPTPKVCLVDTTGAGDTFNGALAVALTNGLALEQAIAFSNLAAAMSVTKFGAQEGMPTIEELKQHPAFKEDENE